MPPLYQDRLLTRDPAYETGEQLLAQRRDVRQRYVAVVVRQETVTAI